MFIFISQNLKWKNLLIFFVILIFVSATYFMNGNLTLKLIFNDESNYDSEWKGSQKSLSFINKKMIKPMRSLGYAIFKIGCRIPELDPQDPTIQKLVKMPKTMKCPKVPNVTFVTGNILHFHRENLSAKTRHQTNCCYRGIERVTQEYSKYNANCDKKWKFTKKCFPIKKAQVKVTYNSIYISCKVGKQNVYINVHHLIKKKELVASPAGKSDAFLLNNSLSVIIFGTDSVSRLNSIRSMKQTRDYLTNNLHALEFKGFNKVGDNTFPNLMPVLSGFSKRELERHPCLQKEKIKTFDKCPLIWKDFKNRGYITAYNEDSPWMGLFHYKRPGFIKPPTDYYGRFSFIASEKLIGKELIGIKGQQLDHQCQGGKLSLQVIHDYSLEFEKLFLGHPTFSFYWSASLSHRDLNWAAFTDEPHRRYLKSLNDIGVLNHTVLIFMSDHGFRHGKIRETYIGAMEERLPYLFLVFPEWFKNKFPQAFYNLQSNMASLVTHFDLHETLLDILYKNYENETYVTTSPTNGSRGISLFKKIADGRTCKDAGIEEHFCTCQEMSEISINESFVQEAADFIKKYLNSRLKIYPKCVQLSKAEIHKVMSNFDSSSESDRLIFIQVLLFPNVLLEATLKRNSTGKNFELRGEISRINEYGSQSHCINDDVLRKYCVCNDVISTMT